MEGNLSIRKSSSGRLLGEEEAIEYLGLQARKNPKGALRWLMRAHRLPHVKLAKGIVGFRRDHLDEFIAGKQVAAD